MSPEFQFSPGLGYTLLRREDKEEGIALDHPNAPATARWSWHSAVSSRPN